MIPSRTLCALVIAGVSLAATSSTAAAEEFQLPLVGNQFPVVGLDFQGGFLDQDDAVDGDTIYPLGPGIRLGVHHIVTRRLSMNAELRLGATHIDERQLTDQGSEDSTLAFDWKVTALARYQAIGDSSGWTFAGGAHYRNLRLPEASMLQFGLDARFGRHIWLGDETFMIIEAGLHLPLIDGLSTSGPTSFEEDPEVMLDDWFYPTASVSAHIAF